MNSGKRARGPRCGARRLLTTALCASRLRQDIRRVHRDELGTERVQGVIDRLLRVMDESKSLGLAAPQIGERLRVRLAVAEAGGWTVGR